MVTSKSLWRRMPFICRQQVAREGYEPSHSSTWNVISRWSLQWIQEQPDLNQLKYPVDFFFHERTRIPSIRDRNKLEIYTSQAAARKPLITWPLEASSKSTYLTPLSSRTLFSSVSYSKVGLLTLDSLPPMLSFSSQLLQSLSSLDELSALAHHPGLTDFGYLCMAVVAGHLRAPSSEFHKILLL